MNLNLYNFGTKYGGWTLPYNIDLNDKSIIYCVGAGEDISFDLLLSSKYNSNIFIIDPTKRAINHFDEIKNFYKTKKYLFTGNIQTDYKNCIVKLKPNFNKIFYIDKALWDEETKLRFYKQNNPNYVSQTLIEGVFSDLYTMVETTTLEKIMKNNNHTHIDLLKLDIEGAEIKILTNMIEKKIFPRYLCIEFDLFIKRKDKKNESNRILKKLIDIGYIILQNNKFNITLKLNI